MHFLPLRQVLDGRIQRRIRRNGLSEEMNFINHEKRRRAEESKLEMDRLRFQLREKDAEIYQLRNATLLLDTDRIWELEKQVDELKDQLDNRTLENSRTYNWTLAAKDPFHEDDDVSMDADTHIDVEAAGTGINDDDDGDRFGDTTMAELVCSTPTRARASASFPTPPLTSPATIPATPCSTRREDAVRLPLSLPRPPQSHHAGVQADFPDIERQRLEDELDSLRLETRKLAATLEAYTSLHGRLSERLTTLSPPVSAAAAAGCDSDAERDSPAAALEGTLEHLFRALSDKSAAVLRLTASITSLGFRGTDAEEMVASLVAGLRSARLELEYLSPGEIALPLTSRGAEVLDLLLTRLRDLGKKGKEDEASIDEYHELEQSLRQQLGARVDAMDGLSAELARATQLLGERDAKIAELEVGLDRLKGAVAGYVRDVRELEELVGRVEGESRDALAEKDARIEADAKALVTRDETVAGLEAKLAEAVAQTAALLEEMGQADAAHARDVAALNGRAGSALALRDARVSELRGEVDRVNAALRGAHDTVKDLRVEKAGLEKDLVEEKTRAKAVIDGIKDELQRVLASGGDRLSGLMGTNEAVAGSSGPDGSVVVRKGGFMSGDLARKPSSSRKRRRYDSGLGFLDEESVDS